MNLGGEAAEARALLVKRYEALGMKAEEAEAMVARLEKGWKEGVPVVPKKLAPAASAEGKAQRWASYEARGGELKYSEWSKVYDQAIQNAGRGNKAADAYLERLGWGKREVTVETPFADRRLDIADVAKKKGVEVKASIQDENFGMSPEIRFEIERDAWLIKNQRWSIEWHFDVKRGITQPLRDALTKAGIKITGV